MVAPIMNRGFLPILSDMGGNIKLLRRNPLKYRVPNMPTYI
jgi:hypothetical protein